MAEVKMKVVKEIGVISEKEKSQIKLSITEINGVEKYDIRGYYFKDDKWNFGKGIRLSEEEMDTLIDLINGLDN